MRRLGAGAMAFVLILLAGVLVFPFGVSAAADTATKQLVYDEAGLLTQGERGELSELAAKYGAKRETDIIVYIPADSGGKDVVKMTEDFYDELGPGYDKPHGNAVILTMDMQNREVYLAGFYKAKEYLDDGRLDRIRGKITPDLSDGNYERAFQTYIKTVYRYMGFKPGVNPDNIMFNGWFQLAVSLGLGGLIVGVLAYRSGGRVTVNRRTYEDAGTSGILEQQDLYIRTTTTRRKIQKNNGGGGSGRGGGGGGTTSGGHSHSGSRGSF